jgi:hypothetical protein
MRNATVRNAATRAPLRCEAEHGEERPRHRQLQQQLSAHELQVADAVEPAGGGRFVDPRVAGAAEEEPDLRQRLERAVEADRQRAPRAVDHPCIRREAEDHQPGERPDAPHQLQAQRPQQDGERRPHQQHQRPVIAQAQAVDQRHPVEDPDVERPGARSQAEPDHQDEEERVEGVDLGDYRLRPEHRREAEAERREPGRRAPFDQRARAHPEQPAGGRAKQRAQQVHAVRHRADRQQREQLAEQRVQRVARRVLDAEEVARQDEQAVVLQRDAARRARRVEDEERRGERARLQPIPPARPERLRRRHPRLPARGAPQVNEAVVKKFQSAAISAPAIPAAQ